MGSVLARPCHRFSFNFSGAAIYLDPADDRNYFVFLNGGDINQKQKWLVTRHLSFRNVCYLERAVAAAAAEGIEMKRWRAADRIQIDRFESDSGVPRAPFGTLE